MILLVDSREESFYQSVTQLVGNSESSVEIIKCGLPLGDFCLARAPRATPDFLVERKTYMDFWSSIRDGRHHQQRSRWKQYREETGVPILLVLEGDKGRLDPEIRDVIEKSVMRIMFRHHIQVIFTEDTEKTALYMLWLLHMQEDHVREKTDVEIYVQEILSKMPKKRHCNDPTEFLICTLSMIRGISLSTAREIAANYTNLRELILDWNSKDTLVPIVPLGKKKSVDLLTTFGFSCKK